MRRFVGVAILAAVAGACSESGPSSRAADDPTVSPAPLSTVPIPATTLPTTAPSTTAPSTTAAATTTSPARPVEDLEDGEHVGFIVSIEAGVIGFDRVEPVDAEGDGIVESITNANPRVRAVPMPDPVPVDGELVDTATATERLGGGELLVRLIVQGQLLVAIERVTLGAPTTPGG